jgi:apolipoprotein N-acyltransferase
LHFEKDKPIQLFHKSKLVPGVEKMPYPQLFGFLQDLAIDMGGTSGSLGVQDEPSVFSSSIGKVAPVICYESVYGEYVAEYILKGAQWIAIITNDGWWGNTPGYRQHVQYARLRAVEVRRSIARSANTGVSCFINQCGDISQATPYWQDAVINQSINKNNEITFYAKHGDYIGWLAAGLFFPLLLITLFYKRKHQ